MRRCEAKIVRHELNGYRRYAEMADFQAAESKRLLDRYKSMAGVKAASYGENRGGSGGDRDARLVAVLSDQIEAERKEQIYRNRVKQIDQFIRSVEHEKKSILVRAYLQGESFRDIALEDGYCVSSLSRIVDQILMDTPAELAEAVGLL